MKKVSIIFLLLSIITACSVFKSPEEREEIKHNNAVKKLYKFLAKHPGLTDTTSKSDTTKNFRTENNKIVFDSLSKEAVDSILNLYCAGLKRGDSAQVFYIKQKIYESQTLESIIKKPVYKYRKEGGYIKVSAKGNTLLIEDKIPVITITNTNTVTLPPKKIIVYKVSTRDKIKFIITGIFIILVLLFFIFIIRFIMRLIK